MRDAFDEIAGELAAFVCNKQVDVVHAEESRDT